MAIFGTSEFRVILFPEYFKTFHYWHPHIGTFSLENFDDNCRKSWIELIQIKRWSFLDFWIKWNIDESSLFFHFTQDILRFRFCYTLFYFSTSSNISRLFIMVMNTYFSRYFTCVHFRIFRIYLLQMFIHWN